MKSLALDDAGLLQADGPAQKLPPKERAVLRLLLERAPGVVRKDEFAAQAWAGRLMSDESLARCISRVRQLLQPRGVKVEAVYGLGYRLVDGAAPAAPGTAALDSYAHARQLQQQRTPAAMGLAIELLRTLVRDEPGFASARVALADALAISVGWGQLATLSAVEEGLAALEDLDGSLPGLQAARGSLLDMAWRFGEARQCFEQALAQDGDGIDALFGFARHLIYTDAAGEAIEKLRRVRQLAPHAVHVRMMLTRALVQSGRGAEAVAEARGAVNDHPGLLVMVAFSLAIQAMVEPHAELEAAALRLTQGLEAPPFVWTVSAFVLSRLGRREATLDIVDTALLCSSTTAGEAALYAAPLAALGEYERAGALLRAAVDERCGMMAMVLRDPAHAHWLPRHPAGQALLREVFGSSVESGIGRK